VQAHTELDNDLVGRVRRVAQARDEALRGRFDL
jgi:hypothetical protein